MEARKESDYSKFAPFLQQWVDVSHQKAAAIDPNAPVYDVLLDDYEKDMTSERLDKIFTQVQCFGCICSKTTRAAGQFT